MPCRYRKMTANRSGGVVPELGTSTFGSAQGSGLKTRALWLSLFGANIQSRHRREKEVADMATLIEKLTVFFSVVGGGDNPLSREDVFRACHAAGLGGYGSDLLAVLAAGGTRFMARLCPHCVTNPRKDRVEAFVAECAMGDRGPLNAFIAFTGEETPRRMDVSRRWVDWLEKSGHIDHPDFEAFYLAAAQREVAAFVSAKRFERRLAEEQEAVATPIAAESPSPVGHSNVPTIRSQDGGGEDGWPSSYR